jgi:hypothetical protein
MEDRMVTLEELQARIQRLDDVKQIEQLQKIYGYYQDYGEKKGLGSNLYS